VLDLLALRHALAYNPVPAPAPVPVWLPPGGLDILAGATAHFDACDEPGRFAATVRIAEYDPAQPLRIGDAVVTFAPAVHFLPAWAMRVHAPGAPDLGYTGDTGPTANLAGFFAGVEVLIAEATLLDPGDGSAAERGSLTAAEAGDLAEAAGAKILVLTHMWEERGFEACREQAEQSFAGRIELASPGQAVSW
jgi:ribonuclease BN (tRNA processing enzyme)